MKLRYTLLFFFLTLQFLIIAQIEEMSPMPERVSNNAVVEGYVNGLPYVFSFAGIDSTKSYSGIHLRSFRYNVQEDSWESIPPLPDTLGKIATSASRIGDIIYIIGGYHVFENGNEVSSNKVHRYHTQTNTYLPDGAPIPIPIDDQVQVVWRDSLIFVVTGWSNTQNVSNVQIYDPLTDEWSQGTPTPNSSDYPSFGAAGVIDGDTIYYFGGARNGDFDIQRRMKKGIIDPENPLEISWSAFILDWGVRAYRPAAFSRLGNDLFWIGGSDNTYNYDGIAYSNGQGVEPNNRVLWYNSELGVFQTVTGIGNIPMDLRGIANFNDTIQYLAGGMESGQLVSNKTLKINDIPLVLNTIEIGLSERNFKLFPNPGNQKLKVSISDLKDCENLVLKVYDLKGSKIKEELLQNCELELDISDLPSGIYNASIFMKQKTISRKFIKN